jgi:hypothetical protein
MSTNTATPRRLRWRSLVLLALLLAPLLWPVHFLAERYYRDERINRIFEGTNEINRLLILDMLLKRAMKGELDLMGPAQEVAKEIMSVPSFGDSDDETYGVFD